MDFNRKYQRKKSVPEKNSGVLIVETAGYIPAKVQVEQMIMAGRKLAEYRKEMYDFGPDEPDDGYVDPTRSPNYDMADAHQDAMRVADRVRRKKAKADEKAKSETSADLAEKAAEGPQDARQAASGE